MKPLPRSTFAGLAVLLMILAACAGSGDSSLPGCANVSGDIPFGDAGVLPLRALPTGRPCAAGAECTSVIDECAADWPLDASAPRSPSVAVYGCSCTGAVWYCAPASTSTPSCGSVLDGGPFDGGTD